MKLKNAFILLSTSGVICAGNLIGGEKESQSIDSENEKDPYYESFSVGEAAPTPPPEGEPDTSAMDSRSPDEIVEAKMKEFEELENPPSSFLYGITGALEFPHVLNFGLESMIDRKWGVSLNYGSISRNINGIDVGMKHYDVRLRYHPWKSSFFAGLALGQHLLTGEKSRDITYSGSTHPVLTTIKVNAKSNYVIPQIGWFSVWDAGFTIGFDLGVLVPTGARTNSEASFSNLPDGTESAIREDADFIKVQSDVEDTSKSYTKRPLPFLTMMRVGWML